MWKKINFQFKNCHFVVKKSLLIYQCFLIMFFDFADCWVVDLAMSIFFIPHSFCDFLDTPVTLVSFSIVFADNQYENEILQETKAITFVVSLSLFLKNTCTYRYMLCIFIGCEKTQDENSDESSVETTTVCDG